MKIVVMRMFYLRSRWGMEMVGYEDDSKNNYEVKYKILLEKYKLLLKKSKGYLRRSRKYLLKYVYILGKYRGLKSRFGVVGGINKVEGGNNIDGGIRDDVVGVFSGIRNEDVKSGKNNSKKDNKIVVNKKLDKSGVIKDLVVNNNENDIIDNFIDAGF